ncbi:hypothetical protein BJ170DRAFT_728509 [Xylariales sp. AK1849]|nr:hypothetical protein BJ170DRAFT_728509 [Xylariales sp. AK1849]
MSTPERGRPRHRFDYDFDRNSTVTNFTNLIEHAAGPDPHTKNSRSIFPEKKSPPKMPIPVPNSTERKAKRRPAPLDLSNARRYAQITNLRKGVSAVHVPITPAEVQYKQVNDDGTSSVYTDDTPFDGAPTISPLRIMKRANTGTKVNVLKAYNNWKETNSPQLASPAEIIAGAPALGHHRSQSLATNREEAVLLPRSVYVPPPTPPTSQDNPPVAQGHRGMIKSATTNDLKPTNQTAQTPLFTPLTPWLMDQGTRKASKTLFGDHGWLHDTAVAAEKRKEPQKTNSLLDGIKKLTRDLADKADFRPTRSRTRSVNRITISLDAREQSLLYCELEFVLSNTLDTYIKSQLNGGRLDPDKLKKIADAWLRKGRPRVIGFRYDLETQVELIALHMHQFRFYGARQISEVAVAGLLGAMKTNARAMRVRTLCQPDSVVAKHIVDSQALLQLLGATDGLQISLAEVSQFFKVILEREKAVRETRESVGDDSFITATT